MTLTRFSAAWVDLDDVHALTTEREWVGRADSPVWLVVVVSGGPVRATRYLDAVQAQAAADALAARINPPEPPAADA